MEAFWKMVNSLKLFRLRPIRQFLYLTSDSEFDLYVYIFYINSCLRSFLFFKLQCSMCDMTIELPCYKRSLMIKIRISEREVELFKNRIC